MRRAFLCGVDSVSGNSYEHRRGWVSERLAELPGNGETAGLKAGRDTPDEPAPEGEETPASQLPAWCEILPLQPLMPFDATARLPAAIPFNFEDYLELVETTGRCQRSDKRGLIDGHVPRLLDRLGIDPGAFIAASTRR